MIKSWFDFKMMFDQVAKYCIGHIKKLEKKLYEKNLSIMCMQL